MAKVAHARTIGAHAPNDLADFISDRATALGVSESKYVLAILEKWRADGAAPVSGLDEHAQKLWGKMSEPEKQRARVARKKGKA